MRETILERRGARAETEGDRVGAVGWVGGGVVGLSLGGCDSAVPAPGRDRRAGGWIDVTL